MLSRNQNQGFRVPDWVPASAKRYLEHTEEGLSLRDVARREGCHASTVLRQIQKLEIRRDDPLVDEALETLGKHVAAATCKGRKKDGGKMNAQSKTAFVDENELEREARRVLRRLCETGAVLAVAKDMEKAVVLRAIDAEAPTRTAMVGREFAQAFALKGWIDCAKQGRVATYTITSAGRAALREMVDEDLERRKNRGDIPLETRRSLGGECAELEDIDPRDGNVAKFRYGFAESPLTVLARRKGSNGKPFLGTELVQAGERFREDFELAQFGHSGPQIWDMNLEDAECEGVLDASSLNDNVISARKRVIAALQELGPGLSEIVVRCCCFLEGLEAAERRMGWSARSGKIVLRIALQRLRRHYVDNFGMVSAMIG